MKKYFGVLVILFCFVFAINTIAASSAYPKRNLVGIIQWGAGGETDTVARTITPLAEKYLGKTIVLENKTGASGALGANFVRLRPSDGYTLLFGAENPQLYKVLNISDLDYREFYCVNILARGIGTIVVREDSPYKNLEQLIEDAKSRPGQINNAGQPLGTVSHLMSVMLKSVHGVSFNEIPYPGAGPGLTALLGGHADVAMVGFASASEFIRAGKLRALVLLDNRRMEGFDVPAITEIYPEYSKLLPWGPFYGIWIKKDVSDEVKSKLTEAFKKGFEEERFQKFLKDRGLLPLGLSGEQADEFLAKWQSVSTWLLYDVGATKVSPDEFGIPRP